MASTVTLLGAFLLLILICGALWRASRRVLASGSLKEFSVSEQWLLHHQNIDDHD
jgi:hypothetical protein